jgi:molecular chaperone DnaK
MAGKVIGIDLGTTFCAVATLDEHGQPVTLPNRDGEILTPSAVLILDDQTAIVGQPALDVALEQPQNVATLIKRQMGRPQYDRPINNRIFRPEVLSAIILRKLAQDAAMRLGRVDKVVITVPAYFDDTRRKATQDAGRIAGLDVIDILDEPTAAALAYCLQPSPGTSRPADPDQPQNVLVYDLGGGTFDVSIVRLTRTRFQTLAIEGDVFLGGKDWDDRIVEHVANLFKQQYGEDPREHPLSLVALQSAAERAKRNLSKLPQTTITCSHNGKVLSVTLTRAEFEKLTNYLLLRTRTTTQAALTQAGLTWEQVDRILMVGGSTHMPMTSQMLRQLSGKQPDNSLAVSEVVARGAALHAGIAAARAEQTAHLLDHEALDALGDVVEISVNAHSLGIEVRHHNERINDILIRKNTQLPASASRIYRTATEHQSRVRVKVLQGEAHQAEACISIGECWIDDLPPELPKGSPVQVQCKVGADGIVSVVAKDLTSGKTARATLHRQSGMTEEEIAAAAQWVQSLNIQ